jgi:uncharacterized protein YbjT (DUF2867 family)
LAALDRLTKLDGLTKRDKISKSNKLQTKERRTKTMICVTGAGGTVGSEVVRQLAEANADFRAAYHSKEKVDAAREKGIDAVLIDYNDPKTLHSAFKGCDKLFLLGPNMPNQAELEINAVEAAKTAGVRHIVKLSAIGADAEDFDFGRIHREVEKAIEASGLDWTFLRPNSFMQNTVTFMSQPIKTQSAFYTAADDARIGHVDVRDIAAVAVKALTEPGHEGKAYKLNGPEAFTYDQLAAKVSDALGRQVKHINIPPADLKGAMLAEGMPEVLADRLMDLERYYREGKADRNTSDIQQVTGREPRTFEDYARETAATGVWDREAGTRA